MSPKNKGIWGSMIEGIRGRSSKDKKSVNESFTLENARCLVTGANGGLGLGIATHLATCGAEVVMAGRTLSKQALQKIIADSGNHKVEMEQLDLASFASVLDFVGRIENSGSAFSIVVLNAAVVTRQGFVTKDGLDQMTQVNFLSNVTLLEQLLKKQCIKSDRPGIAPRVIVVSSEAHRWSEQIDLAALGEPRQYTIKKAMAEYSDSKFLMAAYSAHLARRLASTGRPEVSVFAFCPGAVNSNLARQAPAILKPLLKVIFTLFFARPEKAARPAVHLAGSPSLEGRTGVYYHLMNEKNFDERAADNAFGERLLRRAIEVIVDRSVSKDPDEQ